MYKNNRNKIKVKQIEMNNLHKQIIMNIKKYKRINFQIILEEII